MPASFSSNPREIALGSTQPSQCAPASWSNRIAPRSLASEVRIGSSEPELQVVRRRLLDQVIEARAQAAAARAPRSPRLLPSTCEGPHPGTIVFSLPYQI